MVSKGERRARPYRTVRSSGPSYPPCVNFNAGDYLRKIPTPLLTIPRVVGSCNIIYAISRYELGSNSIVIFTFAFKASKTLITVENLTSLALFSIFDI